MSGGVSLRGGGWASGASMRVLTDEEWGKRGGDRTFHREGEAEEILYKTGQDRQGGQLANEGKVRGGKERWGTGRREASLGGTGAFVRIKGETKTWCLCRKQKRRGWGLVLWAPNEGEKGDVFEQAWCRWG